MSYQELINAIKEYIKEGYGDITLTKSKSILFEGMYSLYYNDVDVFDILNVHKGRSSYDMEYHHDINNYSPPEWNSDYTFLLCEEYWGCGIHNYKMSIELKGEFITEFNLGTEFKLKVGDPWHWVKLQINEGIVSLDHEVEPTLWKEKWVNICKIPFDNQSCSLDEFCY